ncbi:MAG: hypothetical protein N2050_11895 [Flavobacteriales bacterium]|nr:hypothetical protein [Flavobacteriales bacterium]
MRQRLKKRFFSGWTLFRALYTAMGLVLFAQAFAGGPRLGFVIGGWFFMMGLLGLGCAAGGGCYGSACMPDSAKSSHSAPPAQISYQEIQNSQP